MKRYFAHIGFSAAVALLVLNTVDINLALVLTIASAVMFLTSLILPKYRQEKVFPVCFGSVLFACLLFLTVYYSAVVPSTVLGGKEAQTTFYITSLAQKTDTYYIYTAKTESIIFNGAPQTLKIRIKSAEPLFIDTYTLVTAKLKYYTIGNTSFSSFGYWGKGIYLTAHISDIYSVGGNVNPIMSTILELREDIITTLNTSVKGDEGALAAALVTGDKTYLSSESYYAFKSAGVSHLMSVSGLHLTVITSAFYFVLRRLGVNRRVNSAIMIALIAFYCALAGFSVSVIRAGIMMVTLLFGDLINKRGDTLNSLGLAVFIICLNPFAVSDVGAVLSVLAVLSLSTAGTVIKKSEDKVRFKAERRLKKQSVLVEIFLYFYNGLCISASVLVYTLPALYLFFGYFSVIGVFINVIALPLGSLSTVLSLVTYVFCKIKILSGAVIFADSLLNRLLIAIVKASAKLSFSVLRSEVCFGIVLSAILIVFALCFFIGRKRFFKIAAVLSAAALIVTGTVTYCPDSNKTQFLVCENGAVVLVDKNSTVVYGVTSKSDYCTVCSFLGVNGRKIDLLAVNSDSEYSVLLSKRINCKTVVSAAFDENILSCAEYENYLTESSYKYAYGDTVCSFNLNEKYPSFTMLANGCEITNLSQISKHTILVARNGIYDYNGYIDLSKGDLLYSVSDNGKYHARRLNLWES